MNNRIGIFDSGLGGFSVLRSVIERHGDLSCLYLADNARVPYGNKKTIEIRAIARELIDWLTNQNVSMVLMGCNTTNSLAYDIIQNFAKVEVLGLIKSAAKMIRESRVGVLATPATVASKAYTREIISFKPSTFVIEQSCPAFVSLIESGRFNSLEVEMAAIEYLAPLLEAKVQSIVLGCTHYPFLGTLLSRLIPNNVRLIDPSVGLAIELDNLLGEPKFPRSDTITFSNTRICVTSNPESFEAKARALIGKCPEIELVSLQSQACVF